jgi:hypothetical protein
MGKERYDQIVDQAYENYSKEYEKDNSIGITLLVKRADNKLVYRKPDRETFIGLCKYDKSFSGRCGLKIEERELDMFERWKIADLTPNMMEFDYCNKLCDEHNVPTKLIAVTYNNETIEIYE